MTAFSFALGNIWRWEKSKNRNNLIDYIRKLDVSGVELTLGRKEDLLSFRLSKTNRSWLKSLDYVTIHAPFGLVVKSKDKDEVIRQLDIISKLYKEIDAKNVIIHPHDLPSPKILKRYDFKISTENLPLKRHITHAKLKKIFSKYPKIGLCLDVAHAYLWSKEETRRLIKAFNNKITQIHLSGTYRGRDHQSLRKVTRQFMDSIEPIKGLGVPIVIEGDVKVKSMRLLREEIKYIKKIFE